MIEPLGEDLEDRIIVDDDYDPILSQMPTLFANFGSLSGTPSPSSQSTAEQDEYQQQNFGGTSMLDSASFAPAHQLGQTQQFQSFGGGNNSVQSSSTFSQRLLGTCAQCRMEFYDDIFLFHAHITGHLPANSNANVVPVVAAFHGHNNNYKQQQPEANVVQQLATNAAAKAEQKRQHKIGQLKPKLPKPMLPKLHGPKAKKSAEEQRQHKMEYMKEYNKRPAVKQKEALRNEQRRNDRNVIMNSEDPEDQAEHRAMQGYWRQQKQLLKQSKLQTGN